jgi:hypothetical protein
MNMTTAVGLKRQVELARAGRERLQLPVALKQALVVHVRARRERGVPWSVIESEVGVSAKRLHMWLRKAVRVKAPARVAMRPRLSAVRVMPDVARSHHERGALVVHGARGVSIEGLSVSDVAGLLRELAL